MGYEIDRFKEKVPVELHCPLCHKVLQDAVQDYCAHEHYFCRSCLQDYVGKHQVCPIDKTASISSNEFIVPSTIVKNMLANMQISCQFRGLGCRYWGKTKDLDRHVAQCTYDPSRKSVHLNFGGGDTKVNVKVEPKYDCGYTVESLKRKLDETETKRSKLERDNKRMRQDIMPEIGRLSKEVETKDNKIIQLTEENSGLSKELETFRIKEQEQNHAKFEEMSSSNQVLNRQVSELKVLLDGEKNSKTTLIDNMKRARIAYEKQKIENATLKQDVKQRDDRIVALEHEVKAAEIQKTTAGQQFFERLKVKNREIKELKASNEKLQSQVKDASSSSNQTKEALTKLICTRDAKIKELEVMEKKYEALKKIPTESSTIDSLKRLLLSKDGKIKELELFKKKYDDQVKLFSEKEAEWKATEDTMRKQSAKEVGESSAKVLRREARIRELVAKRMCEKCQLKDEADKLTINKRLFEENIICTDIMRLMDTISIAKFFRPMTADEHMKEARRVGKILTYAFKVMKGDNKVLFMIDNAYIAVCLTKYFKNGRVVTFNSKAGGTTIHENYQHLLAKKRLFLDVSSSDLASFELNGSANYAPFDIVLTQTDTISKKVVSQVARNGVVLNVVTGNRLDITVNVHA